VQDRTGNTQTFYILVLYRRYYGGFVKITDGLTNLTLDDLLGKLHSALVNFVRDVEEMVEENKVLSVEDIRELRHHIQQRLDNREEITDNQKLLTMLDLFVTDSAVMEIIREDAEDWIKLLEDIEDNIKGRAGKQLTPDEKEEMKKVGELTAQIKALIRKD